MAGNSAEPADRTRPAPVTEKNRRRVALIGAGKWGRHYLRLAPSLGAEIVVCCTRRADEISPWLAENHPFVRHTTDHIAALDSGVDGVVIATPRQTHVPLAMAALDRRLHVLVEKPVAPNIRVLEQLQAAARRRQVALITGYTHCFDPSFHALCSVATRTQATTWNLDWHSPAPSARALDVVWEYFPHIWGMALLLGGRRGTPRVLSAVSRNHSPNGVVVNATVQVGTMLGRVNVVTAAPHRHKKLALRAGNDVLATWTDRRLRKGVAGRSFDTDTEPLAEQIRYFLRAMDSREPSGPAECIDLPSDLLVTTMLADLAKLVTR